MSTYVDALKRWADEPIAAASEDLGEASPYLGIEHRLAARCLGEVPQALVFAGVLGVERTRAVAWHYAECVAGGGRRVLFVDLGLRASADGAARPAEALDLRTLIASDAEAPLSKGAGIQLVSSLAPLDGQRLIGDARLADWLTAQRRRYDRIIILAAPVLHSHAASTLGRLADGVVMVVQAGMTASADLDAAKRNLIDGGARPAGVVLIGVEPLPPLLQRVLRSFGRREALPEQST